MKFIGWLISALLFPFVVMLVLAQGFNGFGLGYAIADLIAILFYYFIYLFYGPNRERTLQRWLPIKAKAYPFVTSSLLLFGAKKGTWLIKFVPSGFRDYAPYSI